MTAMNGTETIAVRIVRSMVDAGSIGRIVGSEFCIGEIKDCILLRRGFNDVYEVRLANGDRRIARLSVLRSRGDANIEFEVSLLEHLRAEGMAVATAHRTRSGKLAAEVPAPEGSRPLVLFDYLVGEPPGEDVESVRLTGAELARIHVAARTYDGPASKYTLDADHLVSKPLARIQTLKHLDPNLRDDFTTAAATLARSVQGAALTKVVCHGDCHGGNTFINRSADGKSRAWFFDFDDSGPGYQAYDLAVYLWSRLLQNNLSEPDEKLGATWNAFLDGYQSVADIAESDLDAIYTFVAVRQLWLLGEYAGHAAYVGTHNLPGSWFRTMYELLARWQAHPSTSPRSV
ncbi:aminoglycoside phosphotransferase [bacterium M00.F.Ca.ET.228.01.1.1]|nr:aminoglycoside phosphotransferase [bacterium M00.F.Ca.ET.228.01.1.1]TGR96682.1 aminoglycoside phosphotransferase [bacterium M00.F.Ca.ET.191.01.1.1]TGT97949.1 aminoglycoside phosphotransferase [bacterium M00.F.Ca.ET.155.01.1.1]